MHCGTVPIYLGRCRVANFNSVAVLAFGDDDDDAVDSAQSEPVQIKPVQSKPPHLVHSPAHHVFWQS